MLVKIILILLLSLITKLDYQIRSDHKDTLLYVKWILRLLFKMSKKNFVQMRHKHVRKQMIINIKEL